jgi:hypothetical protein
VLHRPVEITVKSSRSKQAKSYHLSGWYWGKAATRHSVYPGMPVAAFGQKRTSSSMQFSTYGVCQIGELQARIWTVKQPDTLIFSKRYPAPFRLQGCFDQ